ncbi:MAG: penicillin-binding transpeptidase domain-containing protein, partial [Intestinibacillus sp.]
MDNQAKLLRRLIALFFVLVLCGGTAVAALFSLQLINGEEYRVQAERRLTSNMTVTASRGEILDRYGRPLVTNRTVFSLRVDYAYWDKENQNRTILTLAKLVRADGATVEDSLPISTAAPFVYIGETDDKARQTLEKYAESKKLGKGLPADSLMDKLRELYAVDASYGDADARIIVGVRYEMAQTGFSVFNPYAFAHDVSMDLVSTVKERHKEFAGVDVETEPVREYKTQYAAHILGRVGKIYKEEWEGEDGYEAKGYSMNAIVGKDGMEKVLEPYLHGTDGSRSVETNISGNVTGVLSSTVPQPGDNCILTIDLELQKAAEEALAKRISEIPEATAGAAVAVQVGTGEVLAMASYPTYNLASFNQDYDMLYNDPLKPMFNRATRGTYAPGSTFKPLTAIAALEEGVITTGTRFTCNHSMKYLNQTFKCTGTHGSLDVVHAIQKSCNIFFYNPGILLGKKDPEAIKNWAEEFGLGEKTGIELGESGGLVASPS